MAINVSVYKRLPYDPARDFAPVALVCRRAVHPGGQSGTCRCGRSTIWSRSPGATPGGLDLCVERPRRRRPSLCRPAQEHDRHPDDARALQGTAPAPQRRGRRPCAGDVRRSRHRAAADPGPASCARSASRPRSASAPRPTFRRSARRALPAMSPRPGRWWSRRRSPGPILDKLNAELRPCRPSPTSSRRSPTAARPGGEPAARRAAALRQVGDRALGQGGRAGRRRRLAVGGRPGGRDAGQRRRFAHIRRQRRAPT